MKANIFPVRQSVYATVCLFLLLFASACTNDIKENALLSKFSFGKSLYYAGDQVEFINESVGGSGGYTFQWDFGNGQTSTEENPTLAYETNGAYIVTLTVKDSDGSMAMSQKLLTIEQPPLPEVGNMKLKWIASEYLGDIRSTSPAISHDNYIYMTSNDHMLRKFSAEDGSQIWAFDLWTSADGASPEGNTHTTPSIDED